MTIEQELREYILSDYPTQGRPRLELNADQNIESIAVNDEDEDKPARNVELILDHYGMGSMILPAGQDLADVYEGMESRQRVQQILDKRYRKKAPSPPLPIATSVANILETRSFWFESEFLREIVSVGLTAEIVSAKQLLNYLHSQALVQEFDVYQTDFKRVTRKSYIEYDERVILTKARKAQLEKLYIKSRKVVGINGLCRLGHVADGIDESDALALREIIKLQKEAWSIEFEGDFWYTFEDRQNTLINNTGKVFSVVEVCDVETLSRLLANSLTARTSRVGEFPGEMLIRDWIYSSDSFQRDDQTVSFKKNTFSLSEIEMAVVDVMRGQNSMSSAQILSALQQHGFEAASIRKNTYSSSLVDVNRSGGRRNFRFTLVSELVADLVPSFDDPYEILKAKLEEIESLGAPIETRRRREQGLLRSWVFGEASHANCAVCNRKFSVRALVTAHKKKRSRCTESEKRDPYIVFPLCLFGCDYLYEHGFISISGGKVIAGPRTAETTEVTAVERLSGNNLSERWLRGSASYFDNRPLESS